MVQGKIRIYGLKKIKLFICLREMGENGWELKMIEGSSIWLKILQYRLVKCQNEEKAGQKW